MGHLSGFQQVRAIESFLEYLKKQFTHLKAAYPEFGNDRAGPAYGIKQIDSAIRVYKLTARATQFTFAGTPRISQV